VPTSALEGCSATAFRRPFQWESKREMCVKEKERGEREGGREGGGAKSDSESESESERLYTLFCFWDKNLIFEPPSSKVFIPKTKQSAITT